jgi:predicted transcriptional regulator of viral defense system
MKKLSLYRIKELGLGSGRAVFSVQQFSNLIRKPRAIATVYMARLVDNKMAERLLRGKISFVEDDFVIATQMVEPSYISLDSALLFSGIKKQITSSVECVTTKNSIKYGNLAIVYHKIPGKLFFGYKRYKRSNSYIFVAEPAKALIDGLYLGIYSKKDIEEFADAAGIMRLEELASAYRGYGSKKIQRLIESLKKRNY